MRQKKKKGEEAVSVAFRIALDPTRRQARMFASHAGAARVAFNWACDVVKRHIDAYNAAKAAGEEPSGGLPGHHDLCVMWTAHKNSLDGKDGRPADLAWVGNNFVGTYQAALRDAAAAWKNFFDSRRGKRKGRRVGIPKYKSKRRNKPAFQMHGPSLRLESTTHINMPKVGRVRVMSDDHWQWRKGHQGLPDGERNRRRARQLRDLLATGEARIVRGNVSQEPDGLWFISFTVELSGRQAELARPKKKTRRQSEGGTIGLDLGVRYLAVSSQGEIWENPRLLEAAMAKLKEAQRALSRTKENSNRRERARKRVAILHARVRRARRGAIIRTTSRLVREYEHIVVEGWDIQQVMERGSKDLPRAKRAARNRQLADSARGDFRTRLQLAAPRAGSTVTVLDPHVPTGRTCSACGQTRTKPVPPAEERWHCPACGITMPRRLNTARVLVKLAAQSDPSGSESRGESVRPRTPRGEGRPSSKRAARPRSPGRDKTGTPDP